MKTTNEVLTETGLTYPRLNRLKDLGIIPRPKLRGQGRRRGVVGVYEDDIIDIINNVKRQQKSGLSLTQIAQKARQPAESSIKTEKQGKIVTPRNPQTMGEYIMATQGLFEQVARENPGHELHAIRLVAVKGKYRKYLVPIEIEIVPKEQ
jgi:DNA-binding transcriptional MerR regulator